MSKDQKHTIETLEKFPKTISDIKNEVHKVIVGQDEIIDLILNSIFSNGHSLIIGLPGLAKTLLVKTLAQSLGVSFNRIQFTPDLMPLDILGSEILNKERQFEFVKGPIFGNIILADEINRTPPKTQAALLEAMQEKTVTIGGKAYQLPKPFFVLATQNPIEQEGTYPLPEAQLDRFVFSINIDYPTLEEEKQIIFERGKRETASIKPVISGEEILAYQQAINAIPVADNVVEYAVRLVRKTRKTESNSHKMTQEFVEVGAGPRATEYLVQAAKCDALFRGNPSPDIEHIKRVAEMVLAHRIIFNFKARSENITIKNYISELIS